MNTTEYRHIHRTHQNDLFLQAKAGTDRTVQITWYFAQRIHSVDSSRQVNIRSFLCSTYEFEKKFLNHKKKQNISYTNIDHALRTLSNLFFSHSIKIIRKVFHTTKVKPSSQFTKCLRSFFYFRRIFEGFSILD